MKARQVSHAITSKEGMEAALVTAGFEDDTGLCGEARKPLHLGEIAKLVGQRKDTMTGTPVYKIRRAEPFEVIGAGVNPESDAAYFPNDDLPLLRAHVMN